MRLSPLPDRLYQSISFLRLFTVLISLPVFLLSSFTSAFAFTGHQTPQMQNILTSRSACLHPGVTKNANGSYHFSWLHVDSKTGYIRDTNNCIVDLHGFNTSGTEYGDAVSGFPGLGPQRLTWFNSMFKMNYVRLNLNVGWWNSNIYVPDAHMGYQAWIQEWISWAEQNGDYVLLTRTNEYLTPPCGGTITYCPAQAEPTDIDDGNLQQRFDTGHLLDQTLAFWKSIVSLYKNDPAILYNDWNELHDLNAPSWYKVQTTLITTIRASNPRSLIMLGGYDWNNTMNPVTNGQVPDLRYPNLVYDWHIYDGVSGVSNGLPCGQTISYMWSHWGTISNSQFVFARQHGHGVVINEWGGCIDAPTYNTALSSYAASHHISMAYYWAGHVVDPSWTILNANGLLAQAAYAKFSN